VIVVSQLIDELSKNETVVPVLELYINLFGGNPCNMLNIVFKEKNKSSITKGAYQWELKLVKIK